MAFDPLDYQISQLYIIFQWSVFYEKKYIMWDTGQLRDDQQLQLSIVATNTWHTIPDFSVIQKRT